MTAAITTDATTDLALPPEMPVTALIKAREVAPTTT
ncbi:TOBE domain-containing protein [Streptomyces sp. NPDC008086]